MKLRYPRSAEDCGLQSGEKIVIKITTIYKKGIAFFPKTGYNTIRVTGCGSVWLERRLREAEVASSNLVTPIGKSTDSVGAYFVLLNEEC